ncbi:MAG: PEP-CTERM sorting domain-containing protein [Rubripirellula sp.]
MLKIRTVLTLIAVVTLTPGLARADMLTFGIYGASTAEASAVVTGQGHTATVLSSLSAADLTGIDVLWALNSSVAGQLAGFSSSAVTSFVSAGGGFLYHDRRVVGAQGILPGVTGLAFTLGAGTPDEINVAPGASSLVNAGLASAITAGSLNDQSLSSNGYAANSILANGGVLPPDFAPILTRESSSQFVDFQYSHGDGFVYYSTIPLDQHLLSPTSAFTTAYAPNSVNIIATNVISAQAVPEPTSLAFFAVAGMGMTAVVRRRKKKATIDVAA